MKLLAGLAGLSTSLTIAFQIPGDTANGIYSVRTHPDGTEEHTRIGDLVAPASVLPRRSSRIQKRWNYEDGPQCYPEEVTQELDHADTDAANASIQSQCGNGAEIPYPDDFYAISGCTVAYACNFNNEFFDSNCFASDSATANGYITLGYNGSPGCGEYMPGAITDKDYVVAYGYENYCSTRGKKFCSRGV